VEADEKRFSVQTAKANPISTGEMSVKFEKSSMK
jgi:hypothetical protein